MQSEPPFAIKVPQDSPADSSIKQSFLGQMSPLVQQTLAGWRHGERSSVPTSRADAMADDIARARIQNRAQRRQRAAFEVPGSGGNRPRAPQKWRPKVTFSLSRMYPSSPRAKQTTPSSFLASEWKADNGKCSKTDAENEDQMSGKGSIESSGRIDTSARAAAAAPVASRSCPACTRRRRKQGLSWIYPRGIYTCIISVFTWDTSRRRISKMHYEKKRSGYIYPVRQKLRDYIGSVSQI